jgi:hypothetical protein
VGGPIEMGPTKLNSVDLIDTVSIQSEVHVLQRTRRPQPSCSGAEDVAHTSIAGIATNRIRDYAQAVCAQRTCDRPSEASVCK